MWTHHYPSVAHGTIVNVAPGFLNGSCGDFNVQPGSKATGLHKAATPVGKERAPLQWHTVGTFYLACFKIPYSQEGNVQHKKCGLHKQLGHSEPLLSGNRENPPQVQVPRHQPRANLVNFLKQPGYRDTLLHALPPLCRVPAQSESHAQFPTQGSGFLLVDIEARSLYPQTTCP